MSGVPFTSSLTHSFNAHHICWLWPQMEAIPNRRATRKLLGLPKGEVAGQEVLHAVLAANSSLILPFSTRETVIHVLPDFKSSGDSQIPRLQGVSSELDATPFSSGPFSLPRLEDTLPPCLSLFANFFKTPLCLLLFKCVSH